jgi:SAM-dependent methyltransferase
MIELLEPRPGDHLLELAAGPGETGFRCVPLVRPGGVLLSTDAAPEMVEVARRRAAELKLENVEFAVENAAELTLADDAFDAVLCRFGLMLVPEMDRAAAEIARVLRPGGRAVLAVWASSRLNPWMTASGRAAVELGLTSPADHEAPGPFRLADRDRLVSVVVEAGLSIEVVEEVPVAWAAGSFDEFWEAARDTSRMLSVLLEQLSAGDAKALRARAESYLSDYVADDGSVSVPGLARVVAAGKPAGETAQPLPRGAPPLTR